MESFHELLVTLVRLISTIAVIILIFLFVVRPLLDYLIASREIEHRKRLNEEMPEDEPPPVDLEMGRGGGEAAGSRADDLPVQRPGGGLSDKEKLSRLAASDPEKAGDLVRQWVNNDSSR